MNQQTWMGVIVGAIAVTAIGAVAMNYNKNAGPQFVDVLASEPVTKTITTPREVCNDQVVSRQAPVKDPNQIVGTIAGAIVGGVVGSKIGGGDGKKLATVGGAAAGGYAGNKIQENLQDRNVTQTTERRCQTVNDRRQETIGYDVTYQLDGKQHTVRTVTRPGKTLQVVNGDVVLPRS